MRDAESNTYGFAYNALGLVTQRTDPAGNADKYFYNDEGLATTWVNRRGDTLRTTYDELHRRLTKSGQAAVTDSFSYAPSGRIMAAWNQNSRDSVFSAGDGWTDSVVVRVATDPTKRFRLQYLKTAIGQLDSIDVVTNAGITFAPRRYVWDGARGVLDSIRVNGHSLVLGYDSERIRSSVDFPGGLRRHESVTSLHGESGIGYNAAGVDTLLARSWAYDATNGISRIVTQYAPLYGTSRDLLQQSHLYDARGNLSSVRDSSLIYTTACPVQFDTDLGAEVCPGYTAVFSARDSLAYDRVGNITYTFSSRGTGTGSPTYDRNRITSWPGYTFGRDSAGNVTSRTPTGGATTYFHWSSDGLLDSVVVGARKVSYDYNAFGQLVRRRVNGTADRHFLWDGDHLFAELDASLTGRIGEYAYYPGIDQPLALMTGATAITATSFYQQDALGNIGLLPEGESIGVLG